MQRVSPWGCPPSRAALAPALRNWLLEPGSLTARCQAAATAFRVRRLRSAIGPSLMAASGAPKRPLVRVREVLLECDGQSVIFAHTELALQRRGRLTPWLQRLGNRSLGSLLFADPGFRREPLEFRRLRLGDALYRRALQATGLQAPVALWARRSRHHFGRQSVVVTEVFLPAILDLPKPFPSRG